MALNLTRTSPDIIFASVTGPGIAAPGPGRPRYLFIAYSLPPFAYLGLPDQIPKIGNDLVEKMAKSLPDRFRNDITSIVVTREDEFIEKCWSGAMWPLMSLYSPVTENFSEAGKVLAANRDLFLTDAALLRWTKNEPRLKTQLRPDYGCAVSYAEDVTTGTVNHTLARYQVENMARMMASLKYCKEEIHRVRALVEESYPSLKKQIPRTELNDLLVSIRMMS